MNLVHIRINMKPFSDSRIVLVAEDNHALRRMVCDLLRRHGCHVLEASNGLEALAVAEQVPGRVDLLVTDLIMPKIDGWKLAERLNSIRPGMKVLYMSAMAMNSHALGQANIDKPRILPKPFTPGALLEAIETALGGPRVQ